MLRFFPAAAKSSFIRLGSKIAGYFSKMPIFFSEYCATIWQLDLCTQLFGRFKIQNKQIIKNGKIFKVKRDSFCEITKNFVTSIKHRGSCSRIEYYRSITTEQGKNFIFCKETLLFGSCLQHFETRVHCLVTQAVLPTVAIYRQIRDFCVAEKCKNRQFRSFGDFLPIYYHIKMQ